MRAAEVSRKTKETEITVKLKLDGTGAASVDSEDQFLRHMLETLCRYASFDLAMKIEGDNLHHMVEDAAISLGEAFKDALGNMPVERTAFFTIPMDDALVTASVDIVDRPWCDVDCPDDIYHHFFRSFAMSSGITLHIIVHRGFDEHHIIEASFKSLGKALKNAVVIRDNVLSTKDKVILEKDNYAY